MRDRLKVTGFVLWLLATVILGTILLAWLIYPMEISWLRIQNRTGLTPAVIQKNFQILMQYLTSPFTWKLDMPDFPSSPDGLHHFQAVKYLFHLTQALFLVLLPVAIRFIRTVMRKGYAGLYRRLFGWLVLLPVFIGGVTLFIGFDQFFTLFHQVLFAGDNTWLFDPRVDSIILALPEDYFMHAFLIFFVLYEGMCASFYLFSRRKK